MQNLSSTSLRVRYQETDQMGVVHHANYISWFEVARTDWLRRQGTDYRQAEQQGLLLPVIGIRCEYESPARYDDVLEIQARLTRYSGVKLEFSYEIFREEERLVTGQTVHCWTNKHFKPVRLKKDWPHLHALLQRAL